MNADPNKPGDRTPADLARAQQELADALLMIAGADDYWRVVHAPGAVTLTHGWDDGSVDTMVIKHAGAAYAYRDNPTGREVKKFEGTAAHVNEAMRALPAPVESDGSDHTPWPSGERP